jgi:ribosomal protein L6P/L9E
MKEEKKKESIQDDEWRENRKDLAIAGTICNHVQNMIRSDTLVFHYNMKSTMLFKRMGLLLKSEIS